MKKLIFFMIVSLAVIGCAGKANIEIGLNDEGLLLGTFGDLTMRVLKIELPEGAVYNTIWEGIKFVTVSIQGGDFVSITDHYITVTPGSYNKIRLTVDSLCYAQETTKKILIDTVYQFEATAFTEIVIEEGDELNLVVNIVSSSWFDMGLLEIKTDHYPFENAGLKVYYQ